MLPLFDPRTAMVLWSYMPMSGFKSHLLNDIGVEHGQPLCDEGQASHACKDLQRGLDGVGLQQGLVSGSIQTLFTGCHWFVLRTAVQHVAVVHCKESKQRTCCMFMHCLPSGTLVSTVCVCNLKATGRRVPSLKWEFNSSLTVCFNAEHSLSYTVCNIHHLLLRCEKKRKSYVLWYLKLILFPRICSIYFL